jgi:hypothetical protein
MSDASGLPEDIEVGDTYALRTFVVKDGRLASIAQGGGHWEDGICEAVCLAHPDDPAHEVPTAACTCGVYAYWTIEELVHEDGRYAQFARDIVAVVRLEGVSIDGDNGVRAKAAQIVAWWCKEDDPQRCKEDDPQLARACAASAPGTRRYFDRDVMAHIYRLNKPPGERNQDG